MRCGYAKEALSILDSIERPSRSYLKGAHLLPDLSGNSRLPLITGRDCSAEVVEVGKDVTNLSPGAKVIAVIPVNWSGCHAEYVVTPANSVIVKPDSIGDIEACALAYVACTAWAALVTMARVSSENCCRLRFLIHGGSGGVGQFAIHLLKNWSAEKIVATSSEKNLKLIESLGAKAVDYNSPHAKKTILSEGPFDIILDCASSDLTEWSENTMGIWRNSMHVTVVPPLFREMERHGVFGGLFSFTGWWMYRSFLLSTRGRWFMPAFFRSNKDCLEELSILLTDKKIQPIIGSVYSYNELPEAFTQQNFPDKNTGKIVIDHRIM